MHQPRVDLAASTMLAPRGRSPGSHIVVLAYPHSGADRLWALLAGHPSLACTAGTELVPLCDQAASSWRMAEASGSTLSALAAASVRAMTGSLITIIRSQAGRDRWCEICTAPARSARTFLQLYPDTRVIALHRNCADVISAATRDCSRGPGGPGFGTFAAAHPGNPVAAAAAYWCARTEQLLDLERDKAGQCRRVRYEDLVARPAEEQRLLGFLGLRREGPGLLPGQGSDRGAAPSGDTGLSPAGDSLSPVDGNALGPRREGPGLLPGRAGGGAPPAELPPRQQAAIALRIPAPLLEQVNPLHTELGYAAIGHVPAGRSPDA